MLGGSKYRLGIALLGLAVASAVGCGQQPSKKTRQGSSVGTAAPDAGGPASPGANAADTQSAPIALKTVIEPHVVSPLQLKDDDQDKFARAHSNFSWSLFRRLQESHPEENFVYSPVALQLALGLTVVGARGGGENRLARATAPGVKPERIYEVMQSWQEQLLRSMETPAQPGSQSVGALHFCNSLWLDDSIHPTSAFVDKAKQFFGFGVFRVPLRSQANAAVSTINQWVGTRTEGRLAQMVKSLSTTDQAVLLSATHLRTKFISPFGSVEPEPFTSAAGSKGSVDMMHNVLRARYVQNRSFQALELDLVYGATSLVSVMPLVGSPQTLAKTFTAQKWGQLLSSLEHSKDTIDLHWPKLNLRNRYDNMSGELDVARPLPQPFVAPNCEVTSLVHEAALVISQDGIEVPSAAGTAAQSATAAEDKDATLKVVRFDRPFVFAIIHRLTGSILFAGQVASP